MTDRKWITYGHSGIRYMTDDEACALEGMSATEYFPGECGNVENKGCRKMCGQGRRCPELVAAQAVAPLQDQSNIWLGIVLCAAIFATLAVLSWV